MIDQDTMGCGSSYGIFFPPFFIVSLSFLHCVLSFCSSYIYMDFIIIVFILFFVLRIFIHYGHTRTAKDKFEWAIIGDYYNLYIACWTGNVVQTMNKNYRVLIQEKHVCFLHNKLGVCTEKGDCVCFLSQWIRQKNGTCQKWAKYGTCH